MSTLLEKALEKVVTLPQDEQDAIASQILASIADPAYGSRSWKAEDNIYSVRIGLAYRAPAVMNKDRVVWYWIGSHHEYDRLV